MRNRRRWSLASNQRGFVLIALVALLAMGGLYFFISNLSPELLQARRQKQTNDALVQAREALIGYALKYREDQINDSQFNRVYGYLPLPDLGSTRNNNLDPKCRDAGNNPLEGCDAASNTTNHTVIGRFPWRTLGTEPLRDGNGECLWYVVSGSHDRIQRPTPMNWDTLGHLDIVIANGGNQLISALTTPHDRPVAIIFSPGPPLAGQDRGRIAGSTDNVEQCGGNYAVSNYLDPATANALGDVANYYAGATNQANGDSSAPATPKQFSTQGEILRAGDNTLWANACPQGQNCSAAANDRGLALTGDALFGALRKSSNFRLDVNSLLDRMTTCLRDQFAAGSSFTPTTITGYTAPADKRAGRVPSSSCYDDTKDPLGYFSHYAELVFVAKPNTGTFNVTVDGVAQSCAGALIFAGQRDTASQSRSTTVAAEKNTISNYLEGSNLSSFTGTGTAFAGAGEFARVSSAQPAYQDIVRCIPSGKSLTEAPSVLPVGRELTSYDPATRTLTLGREFVDTTYGYSATTLFGCAWTPEVHATGSGVRAYFKFRIHDTGIAGDGFVFAAIDGDRNSANVCGAARQHLGYSGNNGFISSIAFPKLGIEFDTRRNYRDNVAFSDPRGFDPSYVGASPASTSYLNNGRGDPDYTGGHMAIVYWGGETPINTGIPCAGGCTSPQVCNAGICYLNAEEDDNVHGRTASPPATRPPPQNPVAAITPPAPPTGVFKLDPSLSQVPIEQDIHVRVEIVRSANRERDDHAKRVHVVATSNLPALSGLSSIDGYTLASGNRVLAVAQTDARQNGVWLASTSNWTRASSEDEDSDFPIGSSWFTTQGTSYRGTLWRLQNTDTVVPNVSPLIISLVRNPVRVVATTNLGLSGLQTVDGISLAAGDRILLTGQATASENGVYDVAVATWSRSSPENASSGLKAGATWYVKEGSNAGSYWHTTADANPGAGLPIVIGNVTTAPNTIYYSTLQTSVWKLPDSPTSADQIAKMQITTRALSLLDASHQPLLRDTQTIYDVRGAACTSSLSCGTGQFCGIDSYCYSPAFRTTRLGFTIGQSNRDQRVDITNFATTWLP